jgi:hypothetical protein
MEAVCSQSSGSAGYISVLQASTGVTLHVAGVAANGAISLPGSDGSVRLGTGALELSAASPGAILAQYVVDTGAKMPMDPASAESLFDSTFGSEARKGMSFAKVRVSPFTNQAVAFYGNSPQSIALTYGSQVANVTRGIVLLRGRVLAVDTAGTGAWAAYAY